MAVSVWPASCGAHDLADWRHFDNAKVLGGGGMTKSES
jgi:hypothetical protein